MDDWTLFCAYVEDNFTLTPEKVASVIEFGTQFHLALLEKESRAAEDSHRPARKKLLELLNAPSSLREETINYLRLSYHFKVEKLENPDLKRPSYLLGFNQSWK